MATALQQAAIKAQYLKGVIRRTIWGAAVITSILTTALVFTWATLTDDENRELALRVDKNVIRIVEATEVLKGQNALMICALADNPPRKEITFNRCYFQAVQEPSPSPLPSVEKTLDD